MDRQIFFILLLSCVVNLSYEYRLPRKVIPEHYDVQIITGLDKHDNYSFTGISSIKLRVDEETDVITLHSKGLDIKENEIQLIQKTTNSDQVFQIRNITYNKDVDFVNIYLNTPLNKDGKYILKIPYEGIIHSSLVGFYRSSYKNKNGEEEWLAVTQFESIYARRAFPCFDEPDMKASFSIEIGRRKEFSSISNMPLLESKPIEGRNGWFLDKFEKSVPMSTYLVAFMVSKFKFLESDNSTSKTKFLIWARENAIDQTKLASEIGPKILSYYEKYFDVEYPLPKQDMVAIPDFNAGAMENWGLITYRETALLYDPNKSSTFSKFYVTNVVAHELAHQWFGNLVTMKWWTDLWLNEGFATYVAILGTNEIFPNWNIKDEEAVDNILDVFNLDSLNTSHPVSIPIGHPNQISQIFDRISYKKGSAILRMMNLFLGEETFREGVSSYLKKYKYKNAEQDDLWESLTIAAHNRDTLSKDITVKDIMDTWTKITGYPLLNINRDYGKNKIKISQRRYEGMKKSIRLEDDKIWWVPLSYVQQKDLLNRKPITRDWLRGKSTMEITDIATPDNWVLFNLELSGLCRINYDMKNWELLINALHKENHDYIPTLNRFQLLIDSMDLAWAGYLNYDIPLRLVEYITKDKEYIPWTGALSGLSRIGKILRRTSDYGIYRKFMRKLIAPRFNKINGRNNKDTAVSDKLDDIKHQTLISSWACQIDVPNCKKHALELFYKWMKDPNPDSNNEIPSDYRSQVYCIGIRKGGEAEWQFLWQRYLNSNLASDRQTILKSLACSTETWLLERYLQWSIEPSAIRLQDSFIVFDKVASSDNGFYVAKKFLIERISDISKHYKTVPERIGGFVKSVANQIISDYEYKELNNWVELNMHHLEASNLGVQQALESARLKLDWIKMHKENVINIMKKIVN